MRSMWRYIAPWPKGRSWHFYSLMQQTNGSKITLPQKPVFQSMTYAAALLQLCCSSLSLSLSLSLVTWLISLLQLCCTSYNSAQVQRSMSYDAALSIEYLSTIEMYAFQASLLYVTVCVCFRCVCVCFVCNNIPVYTHREREGHIQIHRYIHHKFEGSSRKALRFESSPKSSLIFSILYL